MYNKLVHDVETVEEESQFYDGKFDNRAKFMRSGSQWC